MRDAIQLESKDDEREPSPWVFPSPRKDGPHVRHAQKAFERLVARSGVKFRGHDLRRTAASLMVGGGVPRLVVSKILNHVETGVTAVYDRHSYDPEKRAALDNWGKPIGADRGRQGAGEGACIRRSVEPSAGYACTGI